MLCRIHSLLLFDCVRERERGQAEREREQGNRGHRTQDGCRQDAGRRQAGRCYRKSPKNPTGDGKTAPPPSKNKSVSVGGRLACARILPKHYGYLIIFFYYLCIMDKEWEIEIQNRIPTGLVLGFSIYPPDEEFEDGEIILYLIIISIHYKWRYV